MRVSFGSIYRIPITQPGVNSAKKERLRELADKYDGLIGRDNKSSARICVPNELDSTLEKDIKDIGYRAYQKLEGEYVPKSELDSYIKRRLDSRDYDQKGRQKKAKGKRH